MTCGMDSVTQQQILFPNFSTHTEKDSMGKKLETLCSQLSNNHIYSNDMNIKQDARREWHSNILINHLKHMKQKQFRAPRRAAPCALVPGMRTARPGHSVENHTVAVRAARL